MRQLGQGTRPLRAHIAVKPLAPIRLLSRILIPLAAPILAAIIAPAMAYAGPPFQTDDPQPIDFGHYELYAFGNADGTGVEMDTEGPALEFNWGALPNVHLHLIVPAAAVFPSNNAKYAPSGTGPNAFGLGDIETGVKYRFIQETKRRPMIGTFTMFEVPSGNAAKGLGVGKGWAKLPLWAQKGFGHWTTYGGAGETINTATGYRNFTYGGWLIQRDFGKKLTLGTEVFSHGREGLATAQTRAATLVDTGGYYYFRNPGFQLLFCYGHSVAGQAETYGYLGLYWTWGGKAGKGGDSDKDAPSFARLLPLR